MEEVNIDQAEQAEQGKVAIPRDYLKIDVGAPNQDIEITVNKNTHKIRFRDETEDKVIIHIDPCLYHIE